MVSSAALDKKKSSDKSSFDCFPFRTAAEDFNPLPEVSAVTVEIAVVAFIPNRALVPPVPVVEAVATPSTMANLPISIFEDAWPLSPTPTAEFAGIFSPVDPLAMLNFLVRLLYDTSTPYALWVSAAIWSPVNNTDSAFNTAPPPIFDEALLVCVFKPIAFALFPSPGA